ncbi:hypothetical protein A8F94_09585 [Bacillus sp. FJAT-27225]|uniref:hypothetical protein n=1 Tax=Bacillus sp. FJAT-27225 TaxID=1743144 RepID=UPI00080C236B|nr:hypothetical protein [Bacillus sp. FJAT-27225]OCA88062.1 hypothetical protein A8F94_09585 [Bacillus sp. FJAT-27225]
MITLDGFKITKCPGGVLVYIESYDLELPIKNKEIERLYYNGNLDVLFYKIDKEMLKFQLAEMELEQRRLHRNVYHTLFPETGHDYLKNPREFVLGLFTLLIKACEEESDEKVKFLAYSLHKLVPTEAVFDEQAFLDSYILDSQFAKNEYLHDEEAAKLKRRYRLRPTLNEGEKLLVRDIAESINTEYFALPAGSAADYSAIRLEAVAGYEIIQSAYIPAKAVLDTAELLHKDDVLVDLKLSFMDLEDALARSQPRLPSVRITFKAINELHNDYQFFYYHYRYLTEESRRRLAAALTAERQYKDSMDLFPYATHIASLMGVIEREMNEIISKIEGKTKARSLSQVAAYMRSQPIADFASAVMYEEYTSTIDALRSYRNPASQWSGATAEEYKKVKSFVMKSGILDRITAYKKSHLSR